MIMTEAAEQWANIQSEMEVDQVQQYGKDQ